MKIRWNRVRPGVYTSDSGAFVIRRDGPRDWSAWRIGYLIARAASLKAAKVAVDKAIDEYIWLVSDDDNDW